MKMNYLQLMLHKVAPALLTLLLLLGWSHEKANAQSGTYEKITSLAELTDGYYVITNSTGLFAMTSDHNGTYLAKADVTPTSDQFVDPALNTIWKIETNGAGRTIYSEYTTAQYLSYTGSSNNVQVVSSVSSDNQRWTVSYVNDEFIFTNMVETARMLQYNPGAPRFACYTSNQNKLSLYKLANLAPTLTATPASLSTLDYFLGNGPSAAQSFSLSGSNLDGTDVTLSVPAISNFEIADSETGTYSNQLVLSSFDGTATTVYARLKSGLTENTYTETLNISGGGATATSLSLSGSVLPPPPVPTIADTTIYGELNQMMNATLNATENPINFSLTSGVLPPGIIFNSANGNFNGTPTAAATYNLTVTATNMSGTSAPANVTLVINLASQTATLNDITAYIGDADITLPAVTDQGISITYTSSDASVASVAGNTLTIGALGTANIYASNFGVPAIMAGFADTFTVTVTEAPVLPWEDFEIGSKSSYSAGTVTTTAGIWLMDDALIGSTSSDQLNGTQAVRLRNNFIQTNFDITGGIGEVTIHHGVYGSDELNQTWVLKISDDGGATWDAFESSPVTVPEILAPTTIAVNLAGDLRMRIEKTSSAGERFNIDDIFITPYSGSAPSITLDALTPNAVCADAPATIDVAFTTSGFSGAQTYTVELSDSLGDFASPLVSQSGSASPISLSVPEHTLTATGTYQFRVTNASVLSDTILLTVNPSGIAASSTTASANQDANSSELYTDGASCDAIIQLAPTADLGLVTVSVEVGANPGNVNGEPFLGRYYEITPTTNTNSTADIVLYFSQADFDAYNNLPSVLDGTYPAILADGSNLLITAFHGLPTDGTTGPNGEWDTANATVYTPVVTQNSAVIFEAALTVNGFSGFFAHTNTSGIPLFLALSNFTATNKGANNVLNWTSNKEEVGDRFVIERSADAREFNAIAQVAAKGTAPATYQYIDEQALNGINYYRLQLINKNGSSSYSAVVSVQNDGSEKWQVVAYPNPVKEVLLVAFEGTQAPATLRIIDAVGRVQLQQELPAVGTHQVSTSSLAAGTYYLHVSSGAKTQTIKINKQ